MNKKSNKNAISIIEVVVTLTISAVFFTFILSSFAIMSHVKMMKTIEGIVSLENKIYSFAYTYNQLPGDINNATEYWSPQNFQDFCKYYDSNGNKLTITDGFNGNGDGYIDIEENNTNNPNAVFTESTALLCHLRLSKMIDYNPTVIKLDGGFKYDKKIDNWYFKTNYKNINLIVGKKLKRWTTHNDVVGFEKINEIMVVGSDLSEEKKWPSELSNKEIFFIDVKIDDGMPGTGRLRCTGIKRDCCTNAKQIDEKRECVRSSEYFKDNVKSSSIPIYIFSTKN